jgi:hypothetical protein
MVREGGDEEIGDDVVRREGTGMVKNGWRDGMGVLHWGIGNGIVYMWIQYVGPRDPYLKCMNKIALKVSRSYFRLN